MTSLRFWIQRLIRLPTRHYDFGYRGTHFVFSTHHDFVLISYSARITILRQFRHDFVSISCSACITISHDNRQCTSDFRVRPRITSCPDLSKFRRHQSNGSHSDVTKVMDHNRSYTKCHLQPYKRFLQMTCNCGTPLIHISHAQNIVDIFFIHFHLPCCKNPENKNYVCIN